MSSTNSPGASFQIIMPL